MGNLLRDCENLLKQAWGEVKCVNKSSTREKLELLNHLLNEIHKTVDYRSEESFKALRAITLKKIGAHDGPFTTWKSCKQYYESLIMLLNSNYERYKLFNIGNAKKYLNEAIPMYCRLSGSQPPILKGQRFDLNSHLKDGTILLLLKIDIKDISIATNVEQYLYCISNNMDCLIIASKNNYVLQVVKRALSNTGIDIADTCYRVSLLNTRTKKELKINSYSDIKRILNK